MAAAPAELPAEAAQTVGLLLADRAERQANPPVTRHAQVRPITARRIAARPVARKARPVAPRRPARPAVRHVTHHARPAARHTVQSLSRRAVAPPGRGGVSAAVGYGLAQRGDPYVYGAAGPGSFDCSGLTQRSFARAGVRLPHSAAGQSDRGRGVSRRQARAGDLVLWGGVGSADHVGIYLGGGRVLHAPHSGTSVQVSDLWGHPQFRRLL